MFGPIFSASFQQSIVRFLRLDESIRLVQIAESSLSALLLEIQHINPKNADLLSSLVLLRMGHTERALALLQYESLS